MILSQPNRYELKKSRRLPLPKDHPVTANMAYNTVSSKPDMAADQEKRVDRRGRLPLPTDPPVTANMAYNTEYYEAGYEDMDAGQVNYTPHHTAAETQGSYVYDYVR